MNDITYSVASSKIKLVAADTNMFVTGKCVNELNIKCNIHLHDLNE